jgi:phospholipid-translocating ATPase
LAVLICFELGFKAVKRNMIVGGLWHWPPWRKKSLGDSAEEWHLELWQELEQDPVIRARLKQANGDESIQHDSDTVDESAVSEERSHADSTMVS